MLNKTSCLLKHAYKSFTEKLQEKECKGTKWGEGADCKCGEHSAAVSALGGDENSLQEAVSRGGNKVRAKEEHED